MTNHSAVSSETLKPGPHIDCHTFSKVNVFAISPLRRGTERGLPLGEGKGKIRMLKARVGSDREILYLCSLSVFRVWCVPE